MPKEVKAYKCNHCSMTSLFKGHVKRHEKHSCRKNPDRVYCKACVHLEFESATPAIGCPINPQMHGNYEAYEPPHWWCSKDEESEIPYDDLRITRECASFKRAD